MRQRFIVALLVAFALVPLVIAAHPGTAAQEATPPGGRDGLPEGVAARVVASGWVDLTAPRRANLNLGRVALAPGATYGRLTVILVPVLSPSGSWLS